MEFDHNKIRRVVEEDRLSSLPDELIHKIMSCFDMKYAVQTCLLSSRWEILWKSLPCLDFSSKYFSTLRKFSKFVTHVLSHRNHQVEVSSVNLDFHGASNQVFVKKIAKYAFSHNVQELAVVRSDSSSHAYPPCLFSSHSLKHFTLTCDYMEISHATLDFPALTALHLSRIELCGDLFSNFVNLKNLTLECFRVEDLEEVIDIITPRLSSLMLIEGDCEVMNVIAPQLENLTIDDCLIEYLNAPPGLSCFCYVGDPDIVQLSKDGFHSLNNVSISLSLYKSTTMPYEEEDACKTIDMLQKLHSAKYLTINADIIESLSSFPDILSHHPSPFGNLICLTIDSPMKKVKKVKMSTEARNFFLENSPNATLIMKSSKGW